MITAIILVFTISSISIRSQSVYADECGDDKDWPDKTKPCPLYGAESETELRQRWDRYYELKGKDWMEAKKAEMDQAIKNGTFTEWIRYAPDNNNANRNVYFYYRLNNQAPLMVIDPQSNQYFMPEQQDPSMFIYSPMTGDYYVKPSPVPWYAGPEGLYVIIGMGSAGALASYFALRRYVWK
jgi:hypothetical protein